MSKLRTLVALTLAVTAALATVRPSRAQPARTLPTPRPNLVFILADDLDVGTFTAIPEFRPLLQDEGTTFSNAFVSLSLCCPSRASILRGQYAHNTGVFWNKGRNGGYARFVATGDEASTVATWLQAGGYDTALLGKYLNGYPDENDKTAVPRGWTEWVSPSGGNPYAQFGYTLNDNGRLTRHGKAPRDFLEDVLATRASAWIRAEAGADRPFFLYLSSYAPHGPATPASRYEDSYSDARYPRTPAFDEADVTDKPAWIQGRAAFDTAERDRADARYRSRLRSTRALVDTVSAVLTALRETGELDHTWIIFTSDNGFHIGEHRQRAGKNTGYDTDLRVPLVVRGPGVRRGEVDERMVVNIDFAPTLVDLAGVGAPDWVDGRSLVPVLGGAEVPWRSAFLLEHRGPGRADGPAPEVPEPSDPADEGIDGGGVPVFTGIRTARYSYLEYAGGERELYDLAVDPFQLENLARSAPPEVVEPLRRQMEAMRACAGASCRSSEMSAPPAGPDRPSKW